MSSTRLVLDFMPLRGGLATAGQRSTINEAQLWEAQNGCPDLDGMLRYRPGLVKHGQTLTVPSGAGTNEFHEYFAAYDLWSVTEENSSDADYSVNSGMLVVSQTVGDFYLSRQAANTSTGDDYALKFSLRLINPAGADTTGGKLRIRVTGDAGALVVHEYVITADGVYVVEAAADVLKYTPTYKLDLGGFHSYEFYYSALIDKTTFWFDGVAQPAINMAAADNAVFKGTSATAEFWMTAGTRNWFINLTDVQYSDATYDADNPPFDAQRLMDGIQYTRLLTGGGTQSTLVVATNKLLYVDIGHRGAWRPLRTVLPGPTFMLAYLNNLLLFDDDGAITSKLYKWDGVTAPVPVEDAPPVRFGAEYRTRLFAAGDRAFPLRVYYTGSRQVDVWFAPEYDADETFDEVLNAGFILIPAETGESVTGIYGEFFGSLVITTDKGIWQVTGSSPASFQVENISKRVGAASPHGIIQQGNQLFAVGTSGVVSIQTAQAYGDLQTALPSGAIADKWSSLPDVQNRVDRTQLRYAYFDTLPSLNIALLGMRGQGSTTLDKTFVFSALNQQWFGPWTINPTFFTKVEVDIPKVEVLMHGDEQGRVTFTGLSDRSDLGATYQFKLSSPMFSGRSLATELVNRTKVWRSLRLFILPRANQDINVRWKTDRNGWQPDDTGADFSQNVDTQESLSDSFRLNIDRLHSQQDVLVLEITLEARGRYFQFELTSDYDFVLQGYQIEFLPGDEEE